MPKISVIEYPLAKKGVNTYTNVVELAPDEAIYLQNLIYKNGLVKRGGQTKFETDEVSAGSAITGLHKFYYGASSNQLLAGSGSLVKYHNGSTWIQVIGGLTSGEQVHMESWLNKCYIANGSNQPVSWNGSATATVTASPVATMFLPYQDRLLSIKGNDLTWSGSYSDASWETSANCGVTIDTKLFGMVHHSSNNQAVGYEATVLLGGANGMYLFKGTDLRVPAITNGDYVVQTLATKVGCNAPRTMKWTPKGTIYLGIDKQVYLLPFNEIKPTPIGHKIWGYNDPNNYGLKNVSSAYLKNACASYHEGFYILSITLSGNTNNTVQWWLDVDRLYQDENGLMGPWYGPMIGQSIACFVTATGNGDSGELYGGEANAATGSFVYQLNQQAIYGDGNNNTAIEILGQTFYNPAGELALWKEGRTLELELKDIAGSVTVDFADIDGIKRSGDVISLSGGAPYWGQYYCGEAYFGDSVPLRSKLNIFPAVRFRRLSLIFKNSSSNENFELYGIRTNISESGNVFELM